MIKIATDAAPKAVGPYSQGIITGSFAFFSGQIPLNPETGTLVEGGIEAQAEQVCQNIQAVLQAAGAAFDDVVKTTCFLVDMADFQAFNAVYERYFTSCPARSCIAVKALPKDAICEIEVIVCIKEA